MGWAVEGTDRWSRIPDDAMSPVPGPVPVPGPAPVPVVDRWSRLGLAGAAWLGGRARATSGPSFAPIRRLAGVGVGA